MYKIPLYIILLLLIPIVSCSDLEENDQKIVNAEKYELLYSYSPESEYYMRRHLVDYFSDLAFGAEYGNQLPILKKWHRPMNIFIDGTTPAYLLTELDTIIDEINQYATDGFRINKVEKYSESNFYIYMGKAEEFADIYPEMRPLLEVNHGLFRIHTNEDFEITSGEMFVDMERNISDEKKKHILREELTQSLGLANDISVYVNSIFFSGDSDTNAYSLYDKETIRLLYHEQIISGLNENSTRQTLSYILGVQ